MFASIIRPFKKVLFDLQNVGAANYTEVRLNEKYTNIQLEVRKALDNLDLITRWHGYMVVSFYTAYLVHF